MLQRIGNFCWLCHNISISINNGGSKWVHIVILCVITLCQGLPCSSYQTARCLYPQDSKIYLYIYGNLKYSTTKKATYVKPSTRAILRAYRMWFAWPIMADRRLGRPQSWSKYLVEFKFLAYVGTRTLDCPPCGQVNELTILRHLHDVFFALFTGHKGPYGE
jgi:phage FluMu protein Com